MKRLHLNIQRFKSPSGRVFLQFTPIFEPDCTAFGALSFAYWQVWEDEPETHGQAQADALANAVKVMRLFSEDFKEAA